VRKILSEESEKASLGKAFAESIAERCAEASNRAARA